MAEQNGNLISFEPWLNQNIPQSRRRPRRQLLPRNVYRRKTPEEIIRRQLDLIMSRTVRGTDTIALFDFLMAKMAKPSEEAEYRRQIQEWERRQAGADRRPIRAEIEGTLTIAEAAKELRTSTKTVKNRLALGSLTRGSNGLVLRQSVDDAKSHRYARNIENLDGLKSAAKKRLQKTFDTAFGPVSLFELSYKPDDEQFKKVRESFLDIQVSSLGSGYRSKLLRRYRELDEAKAKAQGLTPKRPPQKERFRRAKLIKSAVGMANAQVEFTLGYREIARMMEAERPIKKERQTFFTNRIKEISDRWNSAFLTYKEDLQQLVQDGIIHFSEYRTGLPYRRTS